MDEYAIRFFVLLEWHFKIRARDNREAANLALLGNPNTKPEYIKTLLRQYEIAGDILKAKARRTPIDAETEKANIKRIQRIVGKNG